MPGMKLKELGEFDLIEQMAAVFRRIGEAAPETSVPVSRLAVGIGDDAAVWESPPGRGTIATTDAMVEGIHFTPETTGWYDLGWKAMASNVSDIAAMGGVPRYALAVLGARGDMEVDDALEVCRGMADLAARFGTAVVGGDTVSSPVTILSVTVLGETRDALPILSRSMARPGDEIAVTGRLGSSAGGLELMMRGRRPIQKRFAPLVESHRRPMPRVREGQLLADAGVRCGMDLSDGLVGDLARVCRASGVSALVEVERVPMDPLLREAFGERALDLALSGGEDYELVCAAAPEVMAEARILLQSAGASLTVVGRVLPPDPSRPPIMLVGADRRPYAPGRSGWEHFKVGGESTGGA